MNSKKIIKCGVCSFLAVLVFFVSYYAGLFYSYKIAFTCGMVLTIIFLVSTAITTFAEKSILYSSMVLLGCIIFQKIDMHKIIAHWINYEISTDVNIAQKLVFNNCCCFLLYFVSIILALIITTLITYIKKRTDSF